MLLAYLLVRLVEPVRVEEPRPESRLRWPVGEVTDEEVVVVGFVEEEVVEELRSSCLLPKEPLEDNMSRQKIKTRSAGDNGHVDQNDLVRMRFYNYLLILMNLKFMYESLY